jgi:ATP-dependent RNA helicase SUPV3L1/SUV3
MNESFNLPDYKNIRDFISQHRDTLAKLSNIDDEENSRTLEDSHLILDLLEAVQTPLIKLFNEHESLALLFRSDFSSFKDFIKRETILDICCLDEYLFPLKELFFYCDTESGKVDSKQINCIKEELGSWLTIHKQNHIDTQELVKNEFNSGIKEKDLGCLCNSCIADYRTKIREIIYDDCCQIVDETAEEIGNGINSSLSEVSKLYKIMQKNLDRRLQSIRHKLKRSTVNKLDSQIKNRVRAKFAHPSELASKHIENLKIHFQEVLKTQNLRRDLIDDEEYDRWFHNLKTNLWRNEKYFEIEFSKFLKSILFLKRKDISATILKEYLGEFWIHTNARSINRKIIYHMGPTNSGKTYRSVEALCNSPTGCYLAPLRLLAAELYDTMNSKGVITTLLTGEEVIENENATHFSSTIEMARFNEEFDCCVIDEIQMITDSQRGWAWTRALVNIYSPVIHVCGDPSAYDLVKTIADLCGDELEVKNYERMTELVVDDDPVVLSDLDRSDALITFSRRNALRYKYSLEQLGFKVSIVYGRLSPEVRREQARKFDEGETDVIVSTDAIAMGMNLPIQRIIFSTLSKFYNNQEHKITDSEIKQIAGRAGRFQRFETGHVTCLTKVEDGIALVKKSLNAELEQKNQCMVGPDLDIFTRVNNALEKNNLPILKLSEFLLLFNTMTFKKPFFCVDLSEMIELTETVEQSDVANVLSSAEVFGFACSPVNQSMNDHVQYFIWILNHYVKSMPILFEKIDPSSNDIDYLETSIKCVELYQWLSRHFSNKNFEFDEVELQLNKQAAVSKLNELLSDKIQPTCSSCGLKLEENSKFAICELCFKKRRFKGRSNSYSSRSSEGRPNKDSSRSKKKNSGKKSTDRKKFSGKKSTGKKKFGKKR